MPRHSLHCRRCLESTLTSGAAGRHAFVSHGSVPHYAPDLPVRLEHVRVEIQLDPRQKSFCAVTHQTVRVISPGIERLRLDQIGLQIDGVRIQGEPASFAIDGGALWLELGDSRKNPRPDERLEIEIRYHAPAPRRGLYFTGPDADYPGKPYQVWSQGQDEDNRYWIPTFDYPNQKATSEVIAVVPKGFTAVSNGALIARKEEGEWTRFHYKLGTPHVTYLISLVVAEFEEWMDRGPGGVPVQYFVPKGRKADGERAFSHTPAMIGVYAEKTGCPYPYEKYSQAAVQDFIFGGMENTSATTQTDRTLHDERAHLDFSSDPLVAHELAHQWFGDLLTCRDWSHGWLNEGFATFMERVWIEGNLEEYGTREKAWEEAKYYSLLDLKEYLEEDSRRYRRSIVCNSYIEPIDLFDAHLYQKGGLVLNLIRAQLGDDAFWRAIRLYVARHRGGSVETLDLVRSIEDATGRNLRRLFDEWVFSAGHPDFELSYQWSQEHKRCELVIEQKQTEGKPSLAKDGFVTPLFHLEARVRFTLEGGKVVEHRIALGEPKERLFIPLESKPLMVRFDPENTIPKTLKFPRPKELLIYQLKNDCDGTGRIEAAHELASVADREVVQALREALLQDSFWAVQAEIAEALSGIRMEQARDALIAGLSVPHPKARKAIVSALGKFKGAEAARALEPLAQRDPSYFVEAAAAYHFALARIAPGMSSEAPEVADAERFLLAELRKESEFDVIRGAALKGLAELPGIEKDERPASLAALIEWSLRGKPEDSRVYAIDALGMVARKAAPAVLKRILKHLSELAEEDCFRLRMRLIPALLSTESFEALGALERIRSTDVDGRVKRNAQAALDALYQAKEKPEGLAALRTSLEKLEEDYRKLKSWAEEVKAGPKPS